MKTLLAFAALIALSAPAVQSAPLLWTLLPATISGDYYLGGSGQATVQGTYYFDTDTNTYSKWNLIVSGYPEALGLMNVSYTPENSNIVFASPFVFGVHDLPSSQYLDLWFGPFESYSYATYAPITLPRVREVRISNGSAYYSFFAFGTGFVASAPEPVTGVLVLFGAAILCLQGRCRWRVRRSGRTALPQ